MSRRLFGFLFLLCGVNVLAYFRDEQDAKISKALVRQFQMDCSHKGGLDQTRLIELQEMYDKAGKTKNDTSEKALRCYQERMSQLIGVHQLYKDLCKEVLDEKELKKDQDMLRLMLMTQRYRKGITPFHDQLNDCLIEKDVGMYLIPVNGSKKKAETATLIEELEAIKVVAPFEANQVNKR